MLGDGPRTVKVIEVLSPAVSSMVRVNSLPGSTVMLSVFAWAMLVRMVIRQKATIRCGVFLESFIIFLVGFRVDISFGGCVERVFKCFDKF